MIFIRAQNYKNEYFIVRIFLSILVKVTGNDVNALHSSSQT